MTNIQQNQCKWMNVIKYIYSSTVVKYKFEAPVLKLSISAALYFHSTSFIWQL